MNSSLYFGKVHHTRLRPFTHRFSYRVFYGLFDIDEIDDMSATLRMFGDRRPISFDARTHGPEDGTSLRSWVENVLIEADVDLSGGRIMLLAFPKVFGYVFNPISVWYCYDAEQRLVAVLHEVRNTFGDKHVYVVPLDPADLSHGFAKKLHVSPFMAVTGDYEFSMTTPGERVSVGITHRDADGELFRAGLVGTRSELNDRSLVRALITHPLMTVKVIGAIHWQALILWRKGAKFHSRPSPPAAPHTVVRRLDPSLKEIP